MKKLIYLISCCLFLTFSTLSLTSCSKKTGCPSTENASVKADKKGNMPTKRGKSGLFPKNMTSKKRKN